MEFTTRHLGAYSGRPAKIIELTVMVENSTITTEVTDLDGRVDVGLIESLRELADELENHNDLIDEERDHDKLTQ